MKYDLKYFKIINSFSLINMDKRISQMLILNFWFTSLKYCFIKNRIFINKVINIIITT